jgi:dihydropteroate synthase
MGVVNVTPDSFSDGGDFLRADDAVAHALDLVSQGANIVDLGGESTKPGALRVKIDQEQSRVIPVIKSLVSNSDFVASGAEISIDTMNSETALLAVQAGATIVNDVSGGLADEEMFRALKQLNCKFIVSHWRGFSETMDSLITNPLQPTLPKNFRPESARLLMLEYPETGWSLTQALVSQKT